MFVISWSLTITVIFAAKLFNLLHNSLNTVLNIGIHKMKVFGKVHSVPRKKFEYSY